MKYVSCRSTCLVSAVVLLLALVGCESQGQNRAVSASTTKGAVSKSTVLSTIPADTVLTLPGNSDPAKILINDEGKGVAYVVYRNGKALVIHNGRPGAQYDKIDNLGLSPDGQHVAYGVTVQEKQRRIVWDGKEREIYVDVWDPIFSPDSRHIAYIAQIGDQSHIVVDQAITGAYPSLFSANPVFSPDSSHVAFHISPGESGHGKLVVSTLDLKKEKSWECVSHEMVVTPDKTRVAVVVPAAGKKRVLSVSLTNPEQVKEGGLYDEITNLAFGPGSTVTYLGRKGKRTLLVLEDREEPLPEGEVRQTPVVRPDLKGAGVIVRAPGGDYLHQGFTGGRPGKRYQEAATLVYNNDCSQLAYLARRDKSIFAVVNGHESPVYDMLVTPKFTPDGKFLVCRARKNGERFVVVLDREGKVVREHPHYESVFEFTFTPDGKSVAYGVKQGAQIAWKVERL